MSHTVREKGNVLTSIKTKERKTIMLKSGKRRKEKRESERLRKQERKVRNGDTQF